MSATTPSDHSPTDESPEAQARARGRTHPVNVGHLVMGVAFLGLTLVWLVITADVVRLEDARWLLPLPWLAAGAAGLIATVLRSARGRDEAAAERVAWKDDMAAWKQDWKSDMAAWKAQVKADAKRDAQNPRPETRP